jgi:hypothetical protein
MRWLLDWGGNIITLMGHSLKLRPERDSRINSHRSIDPQTRSGVS